MKKIIGTLFAALFAASVSFTGCTSDSDSSAASISSTPVLTYSNGSLSWSAVSSATKYFIYKYETAEDLAVTGFDTTKFGADSNSYANVESGTTNYSISNETVYNYYIAVKTYNSSTSQYSSFSNVIKVTKGVTVAELQSLLETVEVITANTTITGDQSSGVFLTGRTVKLSPYAMGKWQVQQKAYTAVMGTNPSGFSSSPAENETQNLRPVENVNWYRAIAFCNKTSLLCGYNVCYSVKDAGGNEIDWANLKHSAIPTSDDSNWNAAVIDITKNGYRLPTEAEWEFAARGGSQTDTTNWAYTYSGSDTAGDVAWYRSNSSSKTHEVGKKAKNRLGIYDMSGNVWEWCNDWWGSISSSESVTNPTGNTSDSFRLLRSGGYLNDDSYCAVSNRDSGSPCSYFDRNGFRVVRTITPAVN